MKTWNKDKSDAAVQLLSLKIGSIINERNLWRTGTRGVNLHGLVFGYLLRDSCDPAVVQAWFDAFEEIREKVKDA